MRVQLILASALVLIGPPGVGLVGADHEPDFRWEVPPGFTGDLAVRLTYAPTQPTWCRAIAYFAAHEDRSSPVVILSHRATWGTLHYGQPVELHLGDVDPPLDGNRRYAGGISGYGGKSAPETWTIVASNLSYFVNPHTPGTPFAIEIACDDAGVIVGELAGSREVLTFTHESMRGFGGSVGAVGVQSGDRIEGTFTSSTVMSFITVQARTVQGGTLTRMLPHSREAHEFGASGLIIYDDHGAGNYAVDISRVGGGLCCDSVIGVVAGLSPVDTLDELL